MPYGRSRNNLFGYASAYLALRLGAYFLDCPRCAWGALRVGEQLRRFQAPDGHIPAVLNGNEWMREDWDVYINNPDYNAYAAACLLLAEELPSPSATQQPEDGVVDLGPYLIHRRAKAYFAVSTTGELAPHGSPFFSDCRYAGMVPLLLDTENTQIQFDSPYCWDGRRTTRGYLCDPRHNPWIPYLLRIKRPQWAPVYAKTRWEFSQEKLVVAGEGTCLDVRPTSTWRRLVERWSSRSATQLTFRPTSYTIHTTLTLDYQNGRLARTSEAFPGAVLERETVAAEIDRDAKRQRSFEPSR